MSRTKRKEYTKSKRFDSSCRNHGGCGYCEQNRTWFDTKKRSGASVKEGIKELYEWLDEEYDYE